MRELRFSKLKGFAYDPVATACRSPDVTSGPDQFGDKALRQEMERVRTTGAVESRRGRT